MAQKKAEYGSGPLFRAAGVVYGVMVADVLLVLANILLVLAPLLVALTAGSAQLATVVVLVVFVPVGPSLVAAAYAFNRLLAGEDTGVFRDFVRGYRMNFRQALAVWLPYLAVLAAVVVNPCSCPERSTPGTQPVSRHGWGCWGWGSWWRPPA